MSSGMLRRVGC